LCVKILSEQLDKFRFNILVSFPTQIKAKEISCQHIQSNKKNKVSYFRTKLSVVIPFIILFTLLSCGKKNLRNAEKSLKGNWTVTEIYSAEGERLTNGIDITDKQTETGDLGEFNFMDNTVNYSFTRLNSLYEGSSGWTLDREKVNAGFVRVEVYTLKTDDYDFVCEFGDQTDDAEKNATEIQLIFETEETGPYTTFHLSMEKE